MRYEALVSQARISVFKATISRVSLKLIAKEGNVEKECG
jgi:hypothetical protein